MKIYTKTGDKGMTSLYDRSRVPKNSIRVESYGSIDELNTAIGFARQFIEDEAVCKKLLIIQHKLFSVAGELATVNGQDYGSRITEEDVRFIENSIDGYLATLDQKKAFQFTIPGSCKSTASLHVARTTCRRAERRMLSLADEAEVAITLLQYVNRLSDLLYTLTLYLERDPIYVDRLIKED